MELPSALNEMLAVVLPYAPIAAMAVAAGVAFIVAAFGEDIAELFSKSTTKVAAKPIRGDAVVGYKVAYLYGEVFIGVSGGGGYGFVAEGKLDPGFHCFRDIPTFEASSYANSGSVILEVLLYGEVVEYEDGYIGSNQRVLQVVPNGRGSGNCYSCDRSGGELYLDRSRSTGHFSRTVGWHNMVIRIGSHQSVFICSTCMKFVKLAGVFRLNRNRNRFVSLERYFAELNRKGGNRFPVGYVRDFSKIEPTVIPAESSAR